MDAATAGRQLRRMVAADTAPLLEDADIVDLLELAKRTDHFGRASTDSTWVPTWNLRAAACEGWRWKAGKVANGYDFQDAAGQQFTRSQMHDHCLAMAALYGKGSFDSVPMGTPHLNRYRELDPLIFNETL